MDALGKRVQRDHKEPFIQLAQSVMFNLVSFGSKVLLDFVFPPQKKISICIFCLQNKVFYIFIITAQYCTKSTTVSVYQVFVASVTESGHRRGSRRYRSN